jgi:hypothetical protein
MDLALTRLTIERTVEGTEPGEAELAPDCGQEMPRATSGGRGGAR